MQTVRYSSRVLHCCPPEDRQMNVVLHEMRHDDIPDQATADNDDVGETDDQKSTGTAH